MFMIGLALLAIPYVITPISRQPVHAYAGVLQDSDVNETQEGQMRQIFTIPLIAVASQSAHAHVLDDQEGPISQLLHQLVGTHHLPFTLLLLVIAVIFIRKWRAANSDR